MAQGERASPITQRTVDRDNYLLIIKFFTINIKLVSYSDLMDYNHEALGSTPSTDLIQCGATVACVNETSTINIKLLVKQIGEEVSR